MENYTLLNVEDFYENVLDQMELEDLEGEKVNSAVEDYCDSVYGVITPQKIADFVVKYNAGYWYKEAFGAYSFTGNLLEDFADVMRYTLEAECFEEVKKCIADRKAE